MQRNFKMFSILTAVSILNLAGCHAPQAGDPIPSYDGARLYRENCATCHGKKGLGDGPMVPHLNTPPSNLRTLSALNNGKFPRMAVRRQIDGRGLSAAHGSTEMPVWGYQFTLKDNDMLDPAKQAQARINAVIDHLEAMQN